jgi:hypothetical protein
MSVDAPRYPHVAGLHACSVSLGVPASMKSHLVIGKCEENARQAAVRYANPVGRHRDRCGTGRPIWRVPVSCRPGCPSPAPAHSPGCAHRRNSARTGPGGSGRLRTVTGEDSDEAKPALRPRAGQGRSLLRHWPAACRALLAATMIDSGMTGTTPRRRLSGRPPRPPLAPGHPVSRILLDSYPTGAYWRVTGTSISRSRTRTAGLPPPAARNACRLCRSRHREMAATASGSSSTVHVCAPKQPSAAAARCWVSAHTASTSSRRPGAGRNVVTWIRPACSVIQAPFPRHPRQPPALPRFSAAAVPEPDAQASGGGCGSLIELAKDVTRCPAAKYAPGPLTPAVRCPARARSTAPAANGRPAMLDACGKAARPKRPTQSCQASQRGDSRHRT